MRAGDVAAVVRLQGEGARLGLADVFPQDTHPFPDDRVRERWRRELADSAVDCFVIIGRNASRDGFAAVQGDQLLHFGTAVSTWGSGLAGQAHDELINRLSTRGHREARLWVFEGNERGRRFYARRGWVETGARRQSGFAPHPWLLECQLTLGCGQPGL